MKRMILTAVAVLLMSPCLSFAQKFSVSTNLMDYVCLGTLNVDVSYALSRRWSITGGVKYNPFTFRADNPERQFQYRQISGSLGARIWPWHTLSGWWFAGRLRYQEYNKGGLLSPETEEGDRFGAGLYSGYTHMLSRHFNLEFGLGLWTGMSIYNKYSCQVCGLTVQSGRKYFLLPDDLMISLVYVF